MLLQIPIKLNNYKFKCVIAKCIQINIIIYFLNSQNNLLTKYRTINLSIYHHLRHLCIYADDDKCYVLSFKINPIFSV